MNQYVNTTGWKNKSRQLRTAIAKKGKEVVEWGHDEVMHKVKKNLEGHHIPPKIKGSQDSRIGRMPIPRRTSKLSQSIRSKKLGIYEILIYQDKETAPWGKWVHDGVRGKKKGTKKMRPRRFLADPVRERRPAILNKWRYVIITEVRRIGGLNPVGKSGIDITS